MVPIVSCCAISHGLLHHRRRRPHHIHYQHFGAIAGKRPGVRVSSMPASRARMERRRKAREATKMLNRVSYMDDAKSDEIERQTGEAADGLDKSLNAVTTKLGGITLAQHDPANEAISISHSKEISRNSAILAALQHMSWQDGSTSLNSQRGSTTQDILGAAMRRMQSIADRRTQNDVRMLQGQRENVIHMTAINPFESPNHQEFRSNSALSASSHTQSPKGTRHVIDGSQVEVEDVILMNTFALPPEGSPPPGPTKPSLVHTDSAWSTSDDQESNITFIGDKAGIEQDKHLKLDIPYVPSQRNSSKCRYSSSDSGSTSRNGTRESPMSDHRRKLSLKFPVKPAGATSTTLTTNSLAPCSTLSEEKLPMLEIEERDLEYKHRHIFIGTASLDDFLDRLEISDTHKTIKSTVVKAFIHLASTEQILARQSSPTSDGWEFVQRTVSEMTPASDDYLMQAHVKLGTISLQSFLDMIPWDNHNHTDTMNVVDAFCAASHLDQTLSRESKARAFRSWMVREKLVKNK